MAFRRALKQTTPDLSTVQADLKQGYLPILGIAIRSCFHSGSVPWILNANGSNVGLHAVAAVGSRSRSADRNSLLIRNSWVTHVAIRARVDSTRRFSADK